MLDGYRVYVTPPALRDLENIHGYISQDSPQNAADAAARLMDAIESLSTFPHGYNVPRVGTIRGKQHRSMPVPPYLVRYRIDEAKRIVHVLRIRHGARRWP